MFRWLRKHSVPASADLSAIVAAATSDLSATWKEFIAAVHLKLEVSLATRIDIFCGPASKFLANKYPALSNTPPHVFWMMIFTVVLESKTHSGEDVNRAISELRAKYAKPS